MKQKNTIRPLLAALGGFALTTACHGALVIYEPFDYEAGGLNGKGGTSEIGLTGTWAANGTSLVVAENLTFGSLATTGGSIGGLTGGVNRYGGARDISASALVGNNMRWQEL